ncbi:MAG: class I SAM-dependent methyltransferase [Aquificaceae bacterium]
MQKHKEYQEHLRSGEYLGSGILKSLVEKNPRIRKFYMEHIVVSTRPLKNVPNVRFAKSVLDIGCSTGRNLDYVGKFLSPGAELYGVDLEKNSAIPESIAFYQCDVDKDTLPFKDQSFDLVISTFVLEHLKEPQRLFLESYRVLKGGMYFYCVTEHYTSIFLPECCNFYTDPTHVRPWTKRSLKTLAIMSGFEVQKVGMIRYWEFLPTIPLIPIASIITRKNLWPILFHTLCGPIYIIARKPI